MRDQNTQFHIINIFYTKHTKVLIFIHTEEEVELLFETPSGQVGFMVGLWNSGISAIADRVRLVKLD